MTHRRWCAFCVVLICVCGCASDPLADSEGWAVAKRAQTEAVESASNGPRRSTAGRADEPPAPRGDVTLGDALALALTHNPGLRAYGWEVRAAEARVMQAGLWPNPELDVEIENVAGSGRFTGVDAAETTVSVSQRIALGGVIERRREAAELSARLANWDAEAARVEVMVQVTRRFAEALASERRVELAGQELELARATERVTVERVEAGDASPVERARVQVPVITAEVAYKRAERSREAAYGRLAATWGGREVGFERLRGELGAIGVVPGPDVLMNQVNRNPRVARWATQISARRAARRLAEAEAVPDVTGRVGVKHHNEDDEVAMVLGVSLPVPLFDRRQGDVLAARLSESAAEQRRREAELRVQSMLSVAYAELIGAHDEATALHQRALPAATEAFEATRRAFDEGKLSFLDVLDAQRTLFELQRRYLDALVAYHAAAADIESLIGQRLADLTPTTEVTASPNGE